MAPVGGAPEHDVEVTTKRFLLNNVRARPRRMSSGRAITLHCFVFGYLQRAAPWRTRRRGRVADTSLPPAWRVSSPGRGGPESRRVCGGICARPLHDPRGHPVVPCPPGPPAVPGTLRVRDGPPRVLAVRQPSPRLRPPRRGDGLLRAGRAPLHVHPLARPRAHRLHRDVLGPWERTALVRVHRVRVGPPHPG